MTQAILLDSSTQYPEYIPFSEKRFKWIRVSADFLYSMIASLFYITVSLACWTICCTHAARHYGALSWYHAVRGKDFLVNYYLYGDKIIDFSFNGSKWARLTHNDKEQFAQMIEISNTPEIPVTLELIPDELDCRLGCCAGISVEFLYHYHQSTKITPLEKIKDCTRLFIEEAPLAAHMLQLIHHAQDKKTITHSKMKQEIDTWNQSIDQKKIQYPQESQEYERQGWIGLHKIITKYMHASHQALAQSRNLHLVPSLTLFTGKKENPFTQADKQAFDTLQDGTYYIILDANHAVALIKEKGFCFYVDPNVGTIQLTPEEAFATFSESAQDYIRTDNCHLFFFRTEKLH